MKSTLNKICSSAFICLTLQVHFLPTIKSFCLMNMNSSELSARCVRMSSKQYDTDESHEWESKKEHRKLGLKLLEPSNQIQARIHKMSWIWSNQRQNHWKNATIHCAVWNVEVLNQQNKTHNKFYVYVESNEIKTLHWSVSINTMGQIYSALWIQLRINNNII